MNACVVYYTRSGMTRRVCNEIASRLNIPLEAIDEDCDRSGIVGYVNGALDALRRRQTDIAAIKLRLSEYDRVIIGTPVWCGTIPPAMRTFLAQYRAELRTVSFFVTMDLFGAKRVFAEMAALCGREPDGKAYLLCRDIRRGLYPETVAMFIDRIQNSRNPT